MSYSWRRATDVLEAHDVPRSTSERVAMNRLTRCLLAVAGGAVTVREIAEGMGGVSINTAHRALSEARQTALVVDLADRAGQRRRATIRPALHIVASDLQPKENRR